MESKFLEKYQELEKSIDHPLMTGDTLLVELLPVPEITLSKGSSIIIAQDARQAEIATSTKNTAKYGVVLACGPGIEIGDNKIDMPFVPGNVVLLPELGYEPKGRILGSSFTEQKIGFVAATQIKMSFKDLEEYKNAEELFND